MSANELSDLLGLLSGIALLVTAVRNDGLYAFVDKLRKAVNTAKETQRQTDALTGPITQALDAELTRWSWIDRWSLRAGAALLLLSYGVKVFC
ncbi:hypothetical protein [Hydrogenophaga sp.]|uniref:hypothetical protein n=1 Tax=Hydrogenophaga sp. TaxID=1904254 RepID=UPI003D0F6622